MCESCAQINPFFGDRLHNAPLSEVGDAPAGPGTPLTLSPGQALAGALTEQDVDWVRLSVSPGISFTVAIEDAGGIADSVLILFNEDGQEVAFDDDSGTALLSEITYTGGGSTYYAAVSTYQSHYGFTSQDVGAYRMSLKQSGNQDSSGKPGFTTDQIADQLINGYWQSTGTSARRFDTWAYEGGTVTVDYTALDAPGRWFAEHALAAWTALTGLTFLPSSDAAQIRFDDEETGAHTRSSVASNGIIQSVDINVSKGWISGDHYQFDGYSLQTYIHEIGHALGLGHAGNYDAGDGAIDFSQSALFANDSWQASVMSYFSQAESPEVTASRAYLLTPMIADVAAIRTVYGATGTLRANDTVYGYGSTAGDHYDVLESEWQTMAFTIVDDGGHDVLDFSQTDANQSISLREEGFSDIGGLQGNMGIARGTEIEDLRSGTGDDVLGGNATGNRIEAGAGADLVRGEGGADSLFGQRGSDTLEGGWSDDTLRGGNGHDSLHGDDGNDQLRGGTGDDALFGGRKGDHLSGGKGNDTLLGGDGRDTLQGGSGRDTLIGETGHDRLLGGDGSDRLEGNDGNDRVRGEDGDDTLTGGAGDDTLFGGAGADTFVFAPDEGIDRITDWEAGSDSLDVSQIGFAGFSYILAASSNTSDGLLIGLGEEGGVLLTGVQASDLSADNVLL